MMRKVILAILTLAMIGVGTAMYLWYKPHETVEGRDGIEISASALYGAYGTNEKQANDTYLNKVIEVSGQVSETEENQDGGLMVILDTGDPIAGIQCAMREKGVAIKTGQSITVKGFCSGSGITGVSLTDCILIKK